MPPVENRVGGLEPGVSPFEPRLVPFEPQHGPFELLIHDCLFHIFSRIKKVALLYFYFEMRFSWFSWGESRAAAQIGDRIL